MLLAIDVGNTNIAVGVFNNKKLFNSWNIATDYSKTEDEYGILIKNFLANESSNNLNLSGVIISCVVPPVLDTFLRMAEKYFDIKAMVVGPGIKTGLTIKYENPKEVGADRIVNAVAALEIYGGPCVIVDFGTATTFCAVSKKWEYLGGIIAPGIGISSEALFARASKLPRVEFTKPQNVIGRNTVSSMQSGLFYGFLGQMDEIIRRTKLEMGENSKVIATGGLSRIVATESQMVDVINYDLSLEGLMLLYYRNK